MGERRIDAERTPSGSEWLTLGQAARYLGVAQSTIRKWTDVRRLPAFKTPGGHRRYRRRDLDAFLERSQPGEPTREPLILIVDRDPQLRGAVRASLEAEGCAVREAETAEQGLAALEEQPPDIVLLDVKMPGMEGWEMLRRVQGRHGLGAVPVVMFSGELDERFHDEESASGGDGLVREPFDPQQLVASAKQMLSS